MIGFVTRNLAWKLLSLVLAVLLWLVFVRDPEVTAVIDVPVRYRGIPESLDFQSELHAHHGSAFSLEPVLTQSAWFRAHNRDDRIDGLYLVGAGTHPGAGVPGVVNSAKGCTTAASSQSWMRCRPERAPASRPGSSPRPGRSGSRLSRQVTMPTPTSAASSRRRGCRTPVTRSARPRLTSPASPPVATARIHHCGVMPGAPPDEQLRCRPVPARHPKEAATMGLTGSPFPPIPTTSGK